MEGGEAVKRKEYILEAPKTVLCKERELLPPGKEEVLVRVYNVGICGSDIHLYNGSYNGPHQYPMLFGHEWAGVVQQVGKGVTKFKKGDQVTGDCSRYCGVCPNCKQDKNLCEHVEKFGITIDGASSEYIIRSQEYIYKAPLNMNRDLLCLCEPVAVAAHLIEKIKKTVDDIADKRILVMGGGVIGMAAMMLLLYMEQCQQVELYDLSQYRTNIAASCGAVIPLEEALQPNLEVGYADMYTKAKYDIIIESTGNETVFANALALLRPLGVLGCVGMLPSVNIQQKLIVTKALTILGSIGGTGNFEQAMDFLCQYPQQGEKLISHRFPVEETEEAFGQAMKAGSSMKVVLEL